ncbi:hypothetical protein AM493_20115 [Flavobacterium akiainvivens]|uniref:Thioredoxin domain-containing protein n=1 Tax=Flavobacterium akiainvivens TaxID=1202724 RepID=A0A0M8MFZ7_9FLAO|nr:hypothetical protein AM493_20115 [Flavobacterium akiainvivens]
MGILFGFQDVTTNKTVIDVTVKNTGQEFVTLNYEPRYRGSLSHDGYQTIGAPISKKGQFTLKSDKITDGAEYYLDFNKHIIKLVLFKDDNFKLEADIENLPASVFAMGRGAGKINVMNLNQFQEKFFPAEGTLADFAAKNDSIMKRRLDILESIYTKNTLANIVVQSPEKTKILRIIKETPLTQKEYRLLKTLVELQQYYVADYIAQTYSRKQLEHEAIDFTNPVFKAFNKEAYKNIDNLNHHRLGNALDLILKVEYVRFRVQQNPQLQYKDWNEILSDPGYYDWTSGYLKKEFPTEVHDKYFADIYSWFISMGTNNDALYSYLVDNCANKYYLVRTDDFKAKMDKQPANIQVLDANSFTALLNANKGKNVLLVFWSAQFAGASVVHKIPALYFLEDKYNLEILNICVDSNQYKSLWTARVSDTDWKGKHYFLSTEDNPTALKRFGDTKNRCFL